MKKVTKEYSVYKFEELEKDIQEKVLERYTEIEYQHYVEYYLYEDMTNLAKDLLQEYFKGADYNNIYYDLSYSQGSGSMIEFNIDLEDLNEKYHILSEEETNSVSALGYTEVRVYHDNNFYCHERSFNINYQDYTYYDDEFKDIQDKIEDMIEKFNKDIVSMNCELTKSGYTQLEDKEYFEELARINMIDIEFLENGDEFYE